MKQTKTIPFDWEEYNSNRDKYKVVTRDGNEVTQLTKFEYVSNYPLRGCKNNSLESWRLSGDYCIINGSHSFDLQLQYEEEVVESWVNLYRGNDGRVYTSATYKNKEEAITRYNSLNNYIKTINLNDLV
jgi:hypothetical protein